jgi:putative transposase
MDRFNNKYRVASARAQWWDYGWNGAYFITICTANREHFFGEIQNGKMILSPTGVIADIIWHEIPNHHPNVELGDFVVMPNHIHGILILDKPGDNGGRRAVETGHALSVDNDIAQTGALSVDNDIAQTGALSVDNDIAQTGALSVDNDIIETGHALSLLRDNAKTIGQQRFQNIGKNTVSSIVGSYKSAVTKHANRLGLGNGWQPRFHDHIIRDDGEYQRISDYIVANPENWDRDKFRTG